MNFRMMSDSSNGRPSLLMVLSLRYTKKQYEFKELVKISEVFQSLGLDRFSPFEQSPAEPVESIKAKLIELEETINRDGDSRNPFAEYEYGAPFPTEAAQHFLLERHQQQLRSPLAMRELARNALRHALGALHFRSRAAALPLPQTLKDFVIDPQKTRSPEEVHFHIPQLFLEKVRSYPLFFKEV